MKYKSITISLGYYFTEAINYSENITADRPNTSQAHRENTAPI